MKWIIKICLVCFMLFAITSCDSLTDMVTSGGDVSDDDTTIIINGASTTQEDWEVDVRLFGAEATVILMIDWPEPWQGADDTGQRYGVVIESFDITTGEKAQWVLSNLIYREVDWLVPAPGNYIIYVRLSTAHAYHTNKHSVTVSW